MNAFKPILVATLVASGAHASWNVHEVSTNQVASLPILVYTCRSNEFVRFQIWTREISQFNRIAARKLALLHSDLGKSFDGALAIRDRGRQGVPLLDFMVHASFLRRSYLSIITRLVTQRDQESTHVHIDEYRFNLEMLYELNQEFGVTGYICSDDLSDENDRRFLKLMGTAYGSMP